MHLLAQENNGLVQLVVFDQLQGNQTPYYRIFRIQCPSLLERSPPFMDIRLVSALNARVCEIAASEASPSHRVRRFQGNGLLEQLRGALIISHKGNVGGS